MDRALQGMIEGLVGGMGSLIEGPMFLEKESTHLPATVLRDLFPGPLGDMEVRSHPMPFDSPDRLITEMLQEMDNVFKNDMMPAAHKATSGNRAPMSCETGVKRLCGGAKSWLHCLGQHPEEVAPACRKEVEKSVPFVCSEAVDKYCDVLEGGIIPCLEGRLQDVKPQCRDAVTLTRHVLDKAKTHKASLIFADLSGKRELMKQSLPVPEAKEAHIDKKITRATGVALSPPTVLPPLLRSWYRFGVISVLCIAVVGVVLFAILWGTRYGNLQGQKGFAPSNLDSTSLYTTGSMIEVTSKRGGGDATPVSV